MLPFAKSILIIVVCTLEFWASFNLFLLYTIYVFVDELLQDDVLLGGGEKKFLNALLTLFIVHQLCFAF